MIVIKKKSSTTLIDEKNVHAIDFDQKRKEVWVRILQADGKWNCDRIDKVESVEYVPSDEHINIISL